MRVNIMAIENTLIIKAPCHIHTLLILVLTLMLSRCCVHTRDFKVGDPIPDQILASVEQSRRTVIVLSKEYTQATWTSMEFTAAHQRWVQREILETQHTVFIQGVKGKYLPIDPHTCFCCFMM